MANNTNIEQTTQAENVGNESEVQGNAKKEAKLFTQEEVNGFIQSRLGRMKEQAAKETEAAYAQKIADIEARERRLLLKEQLSDRGMPKELADIITGTDEKDISAKLDTLQKLYGNAERIKETKATGFQRVGQYNSNSATRSIDPVREAMGLS